MSIEKYDASNDIFVMRDYKRDYGKLFKDNCKLPEEGPGCKNNLKKKWEYSLKKQLYDGLGVRNPLFWVAVLGGAYAGGIFQARKQFIDGGDFFSNKKFDFIGGRRIILVGALGGVLLGSIIAGRPSLVKDCIQSKFRSYFTVNIVEQNDAYYCEGTDQGSRSFFTPFDK